MIARSLRANYRASMIERLVAQTVMKRFGSALESSSGRSRRAACALLWALPCVSLLTCLLATVLPFKTLRIEAAEPDSDPPYLFFAHSGPEEECNRLVAFDDAAVPRARISMSQAVAMGAADRTAYLSRLATTRGMTAVFSIRAYRVGLSIPNPPEPPYAHVTMLSERDDAWEARALFLDRPSTTGGGIASSGDNSSLLIATQENEVFCEPQRFFVGRYPLRDIPDDATSWLSDRVFESQSPIGEILVDGPIAHLVTVPLWEEDPDLLQEVISIDTRTMTEIGERVIIEPTNLKKHTMCNNAIPQLRAQLSNDGRHLLTNRTAGELNVVDLESRVASTVAIPVEAWAGSGDLAFNRFRTDRQLLAVHMITKIVLYEWTPEGSLVLRDTVRVEEPRWAPGAVNLAVAWTRGGDLIAAATKNTTRDYFRWRISSGGSFSRSSSEYDLCEPLERTFPGGGGTWNGQVDVVSANDVAPLQRPRGYVSPTAPATEVPSPTPSPSETSEPTATPTTEPTATWVPPVSPVYLPRALR